MTVNNHACAKPTSSGTLANPLVGMTWQRVNEIQFSRYLSSDTGGSYSQFSPRLQSYFAGSLKVLKGEPTDLPPNGHPAIIELWATW